MVFQSYALYPHLTVYENIAFGLRVKKVPKSEIDQRVKTAAHTLGLDPLLDRKPRALSGGQRPAGRDGPGDLRQSAGLPDGRAALEPRRQACACRTRAEIARLQLDPQREPRSTSRTPCRGDDDGQPRRRHAHGQLQQGRADPGAVTTAVNLFVAGFMGSPAMNLVEAKIHKGRRELRRHNWAVTTITLHDEALAAHPEIKSFADGRKVILGVRPRDPRDAAIERPTRRPTDAFEARSC